MGVEALERPAVELEPKGATPALEPKKPEELEKPEVPETDPPTEAEKPEEGEETTDEQEPDLEAEAGPEQISKYKDAYKLHPELRNIVARHNAILELFPDGFKEARQFRELIPTMEDAERLTQEADQYRTMGESFRSDPEGYIESLKDSDSGAFLQLASKMPEVLARLDEGAYREQARYYVTSVLENLQIAAENSRDKESQDALRLVASRLGLDLGAQAATRTNRPDPRDAELERLKRRENERAREESQGEFTEFHTSVDTAYSEAMVQDIESRIKTALPTASEAQVTRMVKEVWEQLQVKLQGQPQTTAQVKRVYDAARNGRTNSAEQRGLVDFLVRRGKATTPGIVKAIITDWSNNVLRLSKDTIAKKTETAERTKDAGSGAGAGGGTAPPAKKPQGRRTSDQIMTELRTGTYQGSRA